MPPLLLRAVRNTYTYKISDTPSCTRRHATLSMTPEAAESLAAAQELWSARLRPHRNCGVCYGAMNRDWRLTAPFRLAACTEIVELAIDKGLGLRLPQGPESQAIRPGEKASFGDSSTTAAARKGSARVLAWISALRRRAALARNPRMLTQNSWNMSAFMAAASSPSRAAAAAAIRLKTRVLYAKEILDDPGPLTPQGSKPKSA